ncbi:hypothetical protein WMY93_033018 [Mugilogobius chulae]|uniref:Uncharacterized protein n=1 Tax=Mugilogobius chulae TaxID=88201 RepID=A0AAW0MQ63_9GOBI
MLVGCLISRSLSCQSPPWPGADCSTQNKPRVPTLSYSVIDCGHPPAPAQSVAPRDHLKDTHPKESTDLKLRSLASSRFPGWEISRNDKDASSETTPGRKRCTGSGSEWEEGVGIYSEEEGGAAGA